MKADKQNTIPSFLWSIIKPYKWWYLLMMQAPIISSFYKVVNSLSVKLLVDEFAKNQVPQYLDLILPISLFVGAIFLWKWLGERGIKLSGGQRQRLAIARAILKDAPILILDEATSSLDSQSESQIQASLNLLIDDKSKTAKKTVIAIAHRLSTLKHLDRIIVLESGKIIEEGKHDELLANNNSLYKKLWELQAI